MASEWFYARDGQKHGPYSSPQLRAMAQSGELLRTDLIWKKGMADWRSAGESKQLFEGLKSSQVVVPAPPPSPVEVSAAPRLKQTAQNAAQAAQLAAERAKLSTATLPGAYVQLGQHCYATRAFATEFPAEFKSLARIATSFAAADVAPSAAQPSTFAGQAQALAGTGLRVLKKQKAAFEQANAFSRLGQVAFEKYGSGAGPTEIVTPIKTAFDRIAAIDQQLAGYKASLWSKGSPTKKQLLIGSLGAAAALLVAVLGYWMVSGSKDADIVAQASKRKNQRGIQQTHDTPPFAGVMDAATASVAASLQQVRATEPAGPVASDDASSHRARAATSEPKANAKKKEVRNFSQWRGTQDKDVPPEYLTGPHGEMIEDYYEVKVEPHGKYVNLIRGYIAGQTVSPEDAIWQGKRQPILEAARRDGTFISHGQRIAWTAENAPSLPDRHSQAIAYAANEPPPEPPQLPDKYFIVDYWLKGKCQGQWRQYHPNGKLKAQVEYVDGNREGLLVAYWPNGQRKLEEQWVRGKKMGFQKGWHENGQQAVEGEFIDDKPDGTWVWWYPNGQKQAEQTEHGGKKEGLWQTWYDDGTLKAVNNYTDGIDEGEACVYWPNGKLNIRLVYKRGKIVESQGWDSDGKEFEQPAKEPLPKSQFEWGIRFGKKLAIGLNQYIERLGWEKDPSLWKKAYRDIAENAVLDAERVIREYAHIPNATDHSKGLLKGFSENYKYNAQ